MARLDPARHPAPDGQGTKKAGPGGPSARRDGPALAAWERVAGLEGGTRDPFADPYGPTPHCLSSNDVVRMFSLGAQAVDVEHLGRCAPCRERVARYAAVTSQELVVASRAAGRWLPRLAARLSGKARRPATATAPALVHLPGVIGVAAGSGKVGRVRVQLIADPDTDFQNRSFHLDGAVTATAGRVLVNEGDAFPWVEFDNAVLSAGTADALKRHRRVTERIAVRGEAPERDALVGTADVELQRR